MVVAPPLENCHFNKCCFLQVSWVWFKIAVSEIMEVYTWCYKQVFWGKLWKRYGNFCLNIVVRQCAGSSIFFSTGFCVSACVNILKPVGEGKSNQDDLHSYHILHMYIVYLLFYNVNPAITFFQVFGKLCPERLKKCLLSLCNLHNSHGIQCRRELKKTVGMAFQRMGPK
jgi:uncharacterized membrane protein